MADPTRTEAGQSLPDGVYTVDADRTQVRFRAKAFGLIWVRGRLPVCDGELTVQGGRLQGSGSLAADRVDTGVGVRDRHLRHSHYLGAHDHPRIPVSVHGEPEAGNVDGEVSLRDMPAPFRLAIRSVEHSDGDLRIEGDTVLDRTPLPMLPPLAGVSRKVQVEVTVVARRDGVAP